MGTLSSAHGEQEEVGNWQRELHSPFPVTGRAVHSAHHRVGADGIWVTASVVTIITLINVIADLKGQSWGPQSQIQNSVATGLCG